MITRIDNANNRPNFQANIIFNETLYKTMHRAKTNIRMWDRNTSTYEKRRVSNFVEALNYILKDGTKDVYEVRPGNPAYEFDNGCYLFKNGKEEAHYGNPRLSFLENVMNIIIERASYLNRDLDDKFNYLPFNIKSLRHQKLIKNIDEIMANKHFGDKL